MKRLLIIVFMSIVFNLFAVTDMENLEVTGYLVKNGSSRQLNYNIVDYNNSSMENSDYVEATTRFIGDDYEKMFYWSISGNAQVKRRYSNSYPLKVTYTLSPLTLETDSSTIITYKYKFVSNYTYIGSTYLGNNGAKLTGNTYVYKDSITASKGSSGTQSVSDLTVTGTINNRTTHTLSYTYTMNGSLDYSYFWYRTGNIYISIPESSYNSAGTGTYKATITVGISAQ